MPWYGDANAAMQFSDAFLVATGGQIGTSNGGTYGTVNTIFGGSATGGVAFAYRVDPGNSAILDAGISVSHLGVYVASGGAPMVANNPTTYWGVEQAQGGGGGGAPEIDGSLAPKVGLLLGCLFLMFGRQKHPADLLHVS